GQEPAGHRARGDRGDHRHLDLPAGPPPRRRLHRPAGHAHPGIPARPGDRGDLRQRQHPPRPRGHRLPDQAPAGGVGLPGPLQPPRQPGRTDLGSAEELRGQHRRHLARAAPPDPFFLPQPLTRPDARHRRTLDQSLAASALRAELLECRLEKSWSWKTISSPSSGWGFGWRTLFAWINSGGLKTTLKASVFDLAALGPVAGDAAAADSVPANTTSTAMTAVVMTLRDIGFLLWSRPSRACLGYLPGSQAPCLPELLGFTGCR